jgi:branched-chain amino acid transport system substrate-binding protein
VGTVPFHALNTAYDEFVKAYKARYEKTTEPIAFTAQNYDAVFVMALAITQAKSEVGKDIRNKLFSVSGANQGQRFEGAFFGEVANAVLAGNDVDYVGPSGELTFDAFGDVVGDYVLWQVDSASSQIVEREPLLAETFNPL